VLSKLVVLVSIHLASKLDIRVKVPFFAVITESVAILCCFVLNREYYDDKKVCIEEGDNSDEDLHIFPDSVIGELDSDAPIGCLRRIHGSIELLID
jgi:hypothetical protein